MSTRSQLHYSVDAESLQRALDDALPTRAQVQTPARTAHLFIIQLLQIHFYCSPHWSKSLSCSTNVPRMLTFFGFLHFGIIQIKGVAVAFLLAWTLLFKQPSCVCFLNLVKLLHCNNFWIQPLRIFTPTSMFSFNLQK